MKYKKVIIFLLLALGAAGVCRVCFHLENPQTVAAVRREVQAAGEREIRESDKIAVVNLDEGTRRDGRQINYAQELSRFPTMDFEYASLEAARTGLEAGRYGAYVIIPAAFSQNVKSINTAPQASQLEYAVNKSYSGEGQYKLLYNVRSYIDSLSNRLSYMYVDNILKEFHEAQDGADRVMENDLKDKEAIEKIKAQELVILVEAPEYQMEKSEPKEPDITEYVKKNRMLTDAMNVEYTRSVQNIRSEVASLSSDGMVLAEKLKTLSSDVPEVDLTVDKNGQSIIEKADSRLLAELERQSGSMPDEKKIACYLNSLLENNQKMREYLKEVGEQSEEPKQPEEATEEISGEPREISEQPEEQSDEWRRFSEQMFAWMEEEEQALRNFIEEVQRTERLDIEGIRGLVRTEYTEPMMLRADEARKEYVQRHEEEIAAVAEYNGKLASFEPRMDDQFILDNISGMTENYALLQDNLLENSRAYGEYAKYSTDSVREYADELQKRAKEAQMKSDETIAEGLSEAQRIKKESSFANQKILADFASKLPYTRIGKAEYTQVYQFVADPVEAEDCSEGKKQDKGLSETVNVMENQKHERNKDQEVSEISDKKKTKKPVAYAVFGGFIVILSVQIYFFIRRRKKEYEY